MNQDSYRNLISGLDKSIAKRMLRWVLRVIAFFYWAVVAIRNFAFRKSLLRSANVAAPVISIGNITTGGTGKTPMVIWICRMLHEKSMNCVILTRGYKSPKGKLTDEPAILTKSCPHAKVVVNSDRISGAEKAIQNFNADVLVMDDGFQHRRLGRDLDIVAIDATCPFGYGRMLPAGLLREPITAIKRADAVVITRYDQVKNEDMEKLEEKIKSVKPEITIAKAIHYHPCAKLIKGKTLSIDELAEKSIFAFCGIGNPRAFLNRLEEIGLNVLGTRIYNDHHEYSQQDITDIFEEARYLGAEVILSTQKDWLKTALLSQKDDGILFAYLDLELEFIEGADKIEALIDRAINSWKVRQLDT